MPFSESDIRANREHFAAKLRAEKQKIDVVKKVKNRLDTFLLVDTRARDAFAKGHIEGAWCVPLEEIDALARTLPKEKEIVAYCWNHT